MPAHTALGKLHNLGRLRGQSPGPGIAEAGNGSGGPGRSEGYPEVRVPGAGRDLPDLSVADLACKFGVDLLQAKPYVYSRALGEHLHCSVGQIPDEAGQPMAAGDPLGRVPKPHALYVPEEDDMSGDFFHVAPRLRPGLVEATVALGGIVVVCPIYRVW